MTSEQQEHLEEQVEHVLVQLRRDLGETAPADEITSVGQDHYERLRGEAAIPDFIPLLVYRFTTEELVTTRRDDLSHAA